MGLIIRPRLHTAPGLQAASSRAYCAQLTAEVVPDLLEPRSPHQNNVIGMPESSVLYTTSHTRCVLSDSFGLHGACDLVPDTSRSREHAHPMRTRNADLSKTSSLIHSQATCKHTCAARSSFCFKALFRSSANVYRVSNSCVCSWRLVGPFRYRPICECVRTCVRVRVRVHVCKR